jgi:cutinase
MKTFAVLSILLSLTVASPVAIAAPVADAAAEPIVLPEAENEIVQLQARQSTSRNELENGRAGSCPTAILIFARGSTEIGNMVSKEA